MPLARRRPPALTFCSTIVCRALGRDDLDVDRVGAAGGADVDARLRSDPAVGPGVLPVLEDVIGERLVVGHHIEKVVDVLAGTPGRRLMTRTGLTCTTWYSTVRVTGKDARSEPARRPRSSTSRRAASSDLSLRSLAAALGTSHRMLIHHFGSKEGLWVEIVRAVEQRQRDLLGDLLPDPERAVRRGRCACGGSTSPTRRCGRTSGCSSRSTGRRSRAARTRPSVLDGIVDDWVEPIAELSVARGMSRERRHGTRAARSRGHAADCCSTWSRPATSRRRRRDGGVHRRLRELGRAICSASMSASFVHTCIRVKDIDASRQFYERLGFEHRGRLNFESAYNIYMGLPEGGDVLELTVNVGRDERVRPRRGLQPHGARGRRPRRAARAARCGRH